MGQGLYFISPTLSMHYHTNFRYLQLNVLYWHVIDSQSFPLSVDLFPELAAKGAYSSDEIYTQDDIQTIIQYANEACSFLALHSRSELTAGTLERN